jgi:hypothetical protein
VIQRDFAFMASIEIPCGGNKMGLHRTLAMRRCSM